MRKKIVIALAVVVAALLFVTNPLVARASGLLTGADIKDNSLKGADIREGSLGAVPKANNLTPLGSGQTQSGAFSAAAGNSGAGGWLGFSITYPRPLLAPIDENNIIDTGYAADVAHCPGPGEAAPGYLCLYPDARSGVGEAYGYSTGAPYNDPDLGYSVGVGLYDPVTGSNPYYNGVWTVTAP